MAWGTSFGYKIWFGGTNFFITGICILCHDWNHNYDLVQGHIHRVYTIILGLQFIYTYVNVYANQVWHVHN